ncbi:MAG TPA: glycosyltransferase family 4 protein [Chthoniobacter sp.]|nr:glycosyltransferase family 4 protein [Chthoniobacter sp.]
MRIAFADFSPWDYHVLSVETQPFGGSQSAACYLARELAMLGHEVFFVNHTRTPGHYAGVTCLAWSTATAPSLQALNLDVFVCLPGAGSGRLMRDVLGKKTRLVLWTQHRIDQPAVAALAQPEESECYDAFAFVSEWQRDEFRLGFGLPFVRTQILRNAAAPAFVDLFPEDRPILPQKTMPPVLAYTSTPYRGLDVLLEAFPAIRQQVPGARLRVFSSMAVYKESAAADQAQYGTLYQRCRETPGVEYVGSLDQPALARELSSVSVLAYPNTFPETSCIAVLEAMASGCRIVTTAQGALPETTAGFARLVSFGGNRSFNLQRFVDQTVAAIREVQSGDPAVEASLRRQVDYIRENATWAVRAGQWAEWLADVIGTSNTQLPTPNIQ